MPRRLVLGGVLLGLASCPQSDPPPSPGSRPPPESQDRASPQPRGLAESGLPHRRPGILEIEYRTRQPDGDEELLKLTETGARYAIGREKLKVTMTFTLADAELDAIYTTLIEHHIDQIEVERNPQAQDITHGSSLRLTAGTQRHFVGAMGRSAPTARWAANYAACTAALEALLGKGQAAPPKAASLKIQWNRSMAGQSASLDIALDNDFRGVARLPGEHPNVRITLAQARPVVLNLRHGTPPRVTSLTLDLSQHEGVELRYNAADGTMALIPTLP